MNNHDHSGTNDFHDWNVVKAQFDLQPDAIHLGSSLFLSSHPKPVRDAIAYYRQKLDQDPVSYTLNHENQFLISGCHKWLYGPRGTGIIAGTSESVAMGNAGTPQLYLCDGCGDPGFGTADTNGR